MGAEYGGRETKKKFIAKKTKKKLIVKTKTINNYNNNTSIICNEKFI